MTFEVIILDDVKEDFQDTNRYLKSRFGPEIAKSSYLDIKKKIKDLTDNPNLGMVVPELKDLGMTNFKQYVHNSVCKIVYEVRLTENLILVHIACSTRRDFQTLLFHRIIRYRT